MKIILVLLCLCFSRFSWGQLQIKTHFSPIANLVYQLDCISDNLHHCSQKNFKKLWSQNFIFSEDDQTLLKKWHSIHEKYNRSISFDSKTKNYEGVKLSFKLRIASFQSVSLHDYLQRIDLVLTPKDKIELEKIITHFYPRFFKWWTDKALPESIEFIKKSKKLLNSKNVEQKLAQFNHFFATDLPKNYPLTFNFFYRPELEKESTNGQQLENYSVTEFIATEKAVERMEVVIHELCHFFFENTNEKILIKLEKEFKAIKHPHAIAANNLLNESLATALGNGIFAKSHLTKNEWETSFKREKSFYNDFYIDQSAKKIIPILEKWLKSGKTLANVKEFVDLYYSALNSHFQTSLSAPRIQLREMLLLADGTYQGPVRKIIRKHIRVASMYTSQGDWDDPRLLEAYKTKGDQNTLMALSRKNLHRLAYFDFLNKDDLAKMETEKEDFYFYTRPNSYYFIIVFAEDDKELDKKIETLSKLDSMK